MFLGIDIGTSSIKAALLDAEGGRQLASASSPDTELAILAPEPGFAEQDPDVWWEHVQNAVCLLPEDLRARVLGIGIGYQMHGLVLVDDGHRPTRDAIIWCDSRAASIGDRAADALGDYWMGNLLNSPGNFTASKLRWVIENEPDTIARSRWAMLPGDYIALRLTGRPLTSNSGLSEMALWDFAAGDRSHRLLEQFEIPDGMIPEAVPTCGPQGRLRPDMAAALGLPESVEVTFRAGDQPTNALALGVMEPGEVAATAGTSGVIYSVTADAFADPLQRVNTFLHVNRSSREAANGVLCCVNGCGSLMNWIRNKLFDADRSYDDLNELAQTAPLGADGLLVHPFGNGAERILGNVNLGAHVSHLDFTRHTSAHLCRAAQESVAFALFYGIEALPRPSLIRASKANLFLSALFSQTVADLTGAVVEIHDTQTVYGAAWGAAMGAGAADAPTFAGVAQRYEPDPASARALAQTYGDWKERLGQLLEIAADLKE